MGIFNFVREAGAKVGLGESPSGAAEDAKDEELAELREGNKLLRFVLQMDLGVEQPNLIYPGQVLRIPAA